MPNDLVKVKEWVDANGELAGDTLVAGIALAKGITASNRGKRPQDVLTGIPDADKAIAQAAGVAEIAGEYGVDAGEVLKVASMLLSLGLTFVV